ncbi:MAG: hypothetical protein AAF251_00315 [Pseudomonadota bacterium]
MGVNAGVGGAMDEVSVWPRALSPQEISALARKGEEAVQVAKAGV